MKSRINFPLARILVTRTDRLGDVLLATPVLKRLREFYPGAKISFLVQKQWMPILQFSHEVELIAYEPAITPSELAESLREKNFDVAIVIRDEKTVTEAVKLAKVPIRVGPYSTLRSFFSFNHGVFQKRSKCKMHEAEYNLELLSKIGVPIKPPAKNADQLPH